MILILNHLQEIETDRVDREKKHNKNQQIAKSIDMCDCSSPSLMKKWLSDIDITQLHTDYLKYWFDKKYGESNQYVKIRRNNVTAESTGIKADFINKQFDLLSKVNILYQ